MKTHFNFIRSTSLVLFVGLFFAACGGDDKAKYIEFSKSLENAVNRGEAVFFNQHFDLQQILSDVVTTIVAPTNFQEGFVLGVKENLDVGTQISGSLGIKGNYTFLRLLNYPEKPTALFRIVSEQEGINYHAIQLGKNSQDDIKIKDFYIYMGGMAFSETIRRLYLSSLTEIQNELSLEDMSAEDYAFVIHMSMVDSIGLLTQSRQNEKALSTISRLPEILQRDKMILMMRTNLAYNTSPEAYQKAITDFKIYYPEDPVVNLIQLDFALTDKKYETAFTLMDELDAAIGGDPYLKVMKADIYNMEGNDKMAEALLRRAIKEEPEGEEAYWSMIDLLLRQERHSEVTALFPQMEKHFKVNPAEFLLEDGYDEFWISEAYQVWESKHPIPESLKTPSREVRVIQIP
ncbi:MAG: tetratricopeptide repeat protein [Chitinophagales bacterium]